MSNFALVNRIMQAFVWLRRIHKCRGFGIQSPTDYSFVRDVVNEQRPYYAYSEVGQGDEWLRCKLGRLYLRLANYMQPKVIVDLAGYADYLHAGCRKADITLNPNVNPIENVLVIARPNDVTPTLFSHCGEKTMLVVEDIGHHHKQWQDIMQQAGVTITYNLYYCGIATFNPARAKQHYTVNF